MIGISTRNSSFKRSTLSSFVLGAALALGTAAFVASPVMAQNAFTEKKEERKAKRAAEAENKQANSDESMKKSDGKLKIGDAAPAFELKDTDGKTVKLEDFKGKVVVLEWYNPECPFVVKQHKLNQTMKNLHQEFSSKNVVFLAINSSAEGKQGYGLELNKKMKTEYKIEYPVLLDSDGKVGKLYGAQRTPHMYVINTEGKLAYMGAIDNNESTTKAGDKNYVKLAVDSVLAGKPVETATTKPYGCTVKYAK
jgi:peroxiredoxin